MSNFYSNSGYEPICDTHYQVLPTGSPDGTSCVIYGYSCNRSKNFFYHLIGILLLGIPYMICSWYPKWKVLKFDYCPLKDCQVVFVTDNHDNCSVVNVSDKVVKVPNLGVIQLRFFLHQHTKYVWVPSEDAFNLTEALIPRNSVDDYLNDFNGLLDTDYQHLLDFYGENHIEVEIKSYWELFVEEVFNPFYIFQLFSILLWCTDDYYIYAGCVFVLTAFSIITALIQTRRQSQSLHDLVKSSTCHEVTVIRRNQHSGRTSFVIDPVELVPGDLIIIPSAHYIMPCDAILLTGQCIVNESMLTGESVPVTKTSPHSCNETYNPISHKRYTLFCGTSIIQTRNYGGDPVLARVVRTGFETTKGALVKSILYPTPISLKFYKDSFKFVFVLFIVAAVGMSYCLYLYIERQAEVKDILIRSLDIITIVVPAALPAAMTVGLVYSQNRLKKVGIFSISPQRINVCGKIKLACFDKTGTLTNDGLDMHYVIPCNEAKFDKPITDVSPLDIKCKLVQAMASCHSLTRIGGELNGDPLDLNMFEFTEWDLEEPGNDEKARFDMLGPTVVKPADNQQVAGAGDFDDLPYEIGIIRQFPFSSTLQCMSVIARELGSPNMVAFVKGAPEKLLSMCKRETIPENFASRLAHFAALGYRVIAIAYKDLPKNLKWKDAQKIKRDVIEHDLTFLGLLIMQNTLKRKTVSVIDTLHFAAIRTVMITGDNILTAISVARECHMIEPYERVFLLQMEENCDNLGAIPKLSVENIGAPNSNFQEVAIDFEGPIYHFAIDGKTWDQLTLHYQHLVPDLIVKTTVFARFQPDQKTQLITQFQKVDYVVSMVGDGANDCGALKAAHVGVSLSQAEASVAAPFTSSVQDISCIVQLMLEGRCALVTSFAVFKYMALYSIIEFFSILILYKNHSILGDMQFLFIDLIITTTLAVTIGHQGPSKKLCRQRPLGSLVSLKNLLPLTLQICACGFFQVAALYYLVQQSWFRPARPHNKEEVIVCWENTVVFTVSCFQYVILALVYSKGKPHRRSLMINFWLLLSAVFLSAFSAWLMVYPNKEVAEFFEVEYLKHPAVEHQRFRYYLAAFPAVHFLVAVFIEVCIADTVWFQKFVRFVTRKKQPRNKYKILLENDISYSLGIQNSI